MRDRFEAVHVQALIAQPTVETLDKCVLHGLARPDEIPRDTASIRRLVERLGRELGAMVDADRFRSRAVRRDGVHGLDDALPGQRHVRLQ
jgi:hypothetical protein